MSFKSPYLSKDELRRHAHRFLEQYNRTRHIPVPIERIVETDFGMDIVPMPGLQQGFDIVAFVTRDLQEIRVDEYIYLNRPTRYRFSLAHELAHRVLHAKLWATLQFRDIESWKETITDCIPEREYSYLEYHANSFAGLVLVPPDKLRSSFQECLDSVRERDIDVTDAATGAQEIIESYIARTFEVSASVVHRRIEADGLWSALGD